MAAWSRRRALAATTWIVAVVAGAWLSFTLSAAAQTQEPAQFPAVPSMPVVPEHERLPSLQFDEEVQPAQFTLPGLQQTGSVSPAKTVSDPPPPVVRIQVRVPADSPPGDDIKYLITIQNTSTAEAHRVIVRNPVPDGIEKVVKAEPQCDAKSTQKELLWSFGTLAPGKTKTIELTLHPRKDATDVKNLAYVSFEHGEVVTTRLKAPTVKLSKLAPKQTVRDEPFTVRIAVDNTGKVPIEKVRVAENVPISSEVEPITKGAKRTAQAEGQQWVWEIPKLMPGERRYIEYRITAREAKDIFALTNLSADKSIQDKTDSSTQVLVPGLTVKLAGPSSKAPVNPGEVAKYEITVRNTGTLPCTSIRVSGSLPSDCKPTMKTEGGQFTRDAILWMLPRLDAGEARTYRFAFKANNTGQRTVVASVSDARGQRAADELTTLFKGTAALVWESVANPVALAVGKQGVLTIRVRNNGGEAARNARVVVDLPDTVSIVQVTPKIQPDGKKLTFGPEAIPAYGEAVYTITFEAQKSAQAWFTMKLTADSLGDRPMETQKVVEITGGS